MHARTTLPGISAAFVLAVCMGTAAWAGPCTSQIAKLDKTLSQSAAMGPATTGALSGAQAGAIKPHGQNNQQASTAGTTAGSGKLGGTGATREMNAASNQVATSPEDVRRQQEGQATMANAAGATSNGAETKPTGKAASTVGEKASQAKMDLAQARALDAKNDESCMAAVKRAQDLINGT